ncbi:MAG TPA: cyclase family protein [Pirellulales bacterium]
MRRLMLACLALVGGMMINVVLDLRAHNSRAGSESQEQTPAPKLPTLADLTSGKLQLLDLGWPLNPQAAFWPGDTYKPFELHTIATLQKDGVLSKAFSSPEHLGTHLDAPNHFEVERPSVDQIPLHDLFAPGVMIDVSAQASGNADYLLSVADIEAFESEHDRIPDGAVVLAYTGWSRFWNEPARYQGKDVMGQLHFPGYSAEAAIFLINERHVRGLGLDTLSVDHGLSRDFPVHHLLGKASRYGLENLAHLEKLPPTNFYLFIAPMKIETGSGGPTRVFAAWGEGL